MLQKSLNFSVIWERFILSSTLVVFVTDKPPIISSWCKWAVIWIHVHTPHLIVCECSVACGCGTPSSSSSTWAGRLWLLQQLKVSQSRKQAEEIKLDQKASLATRPQFVTHHSNGSRFIRKQWHIKLMSNLFEELHFWLNLYLKPVFYVKTLSVQHIEHIWTHHPV